MTIKAHELGGLQKYIERHYGDDGCMVSSSCLDCPLPDCVLERPELLTAWQAEHVLGDDVNVSRTAARLGVSRRTVHRWRKQAREVVHA